MHTRALALPAQYVGPRRCGWGGKVSRARGVEYRPRYVARGILRAAVSWRIGVKRHQACDFRGFCSPGSAWRDGKQERNF